MKKIDQKFINELAEKARVLPRKRLNYNFHEHATDPLQRMLNTWTPEAYVRPHKHEDPSKKESWAILQGKAVVVEFDAQGKVIDHAILSQDDNLVVEVAGNQWHTIFTLEPNTVVFEVKDGPYDQAGDKMQANWAPAEGTPEADLFRQKVLKELGFFAMVYSQHYY